MGSTKDRLLHIRNLVTNQYPTLSSELIHDQEKFLHFWKYSPNGLKYLSNFHLIFEVDNFEQISVKLLTSQSKVLDCVQIKDGELELNDELRSFVQNFLIKCDNFCHGLILDERSDDFENFVEYLNEDVIQRSFYCTFHPDKNLGHCLECQKLIKLLSLKREAHPVFIESEVDIKEENTEDGGSRVKSDPDFYYDVSYAFDESEFNFDNDSELVNSSKKKRGRPKKESLNESGKAKKKRGRPRKEADAKAKPVNRTPRMRSKEEEVEIEADRSNGYHGSCEVCMKSFNSKVFQREDLKHHLKHFSTDGQMNCPVCKEDIDKINVIAHFSENHSPNTCCLVCSEVIPNTHGLLRTHIVKKHHVKPICPTCGKTCYSAYWLDVHINSVHKDLKDNFCHRCGKGFAHKVLLQKHLRNICGMEEWKCPVCPKIFETKTKIMTHLTVHCEEKPYVCPLCTYSCNKMNNMFLHSRKVHQLKGCKNDFFVNQEALKRQREFVDINTVKARPKIKTKEDTETL